MREFVYLTETLIIPVDRICWVRIGHHPELKQKPWRVVVSYWLRDDPKSQTHITYYETQDAAQQEARRLVRHGVIY